MDAPDVERVVLPHEAPHAAHVVAVVAVLVAAEAVNVGVEQVRDGGETVEVFAFVTTGAQPPCKEEAEERPGYSVSPCVSGVATDGAPAEGGGFGNIFVFAVATGPFVVPDVEDGACLGGGETALPCGGVDLRPSRSSLLLYRPSLPALFCPDSSERLVPSCRQGRVGDCIGNRVDDGGGTGSGEIGGRRCCRHAAAECRL